MASPPSIRTSFRPACWCCSARRRPTAAGAATRSAPTGRSARTSTTPDRAPEGGREIAGTGSAGSEEQGQLRKSPQEGGVPAHLLGRDGEAHLRQPPDQRLEGEPALQPRERRPHAEVDPLAEGDVPVGAGAGDVERLRVFEV